MTVSETKFRKFYKKLYPASIIFKIPDFKMTGMLGNAGLPDYLTINNGRTVWCEVKTAKAHTLYIKDFTQGQHRVFYEMVSCGANIEVWLYSQKKFTVRKLSLSVWNLFLEEKKMCFE